MSKFRVFIATTDGPSEIQGILEEDPDLHSVICLNGTSEALPVSRGYDAFVRKPTGVVEKLTGHRVYRMDVAAPITNGNSWQLGAYLAHMLMRCDRLALKDDPAEELLLVTGAVSPTSMDVGEVGHIREKLTQAQGLQGQAQPLTVVLPGDDHDRLMAAAAEDAGLKALVGGLRLRPVRTVAQAEEWIGLSVPPTSIGDGGSDELPTVSTGDAGRADREGNGRGFATYLPWVLVFLMLAGGAAATVGWQAGWFKPAGGQPDRFVRPEPEPSPVPPPAPTQPAQPAPDLPEAPEKIVLPSPPAKPAAEGVQEPSPSVIAPRVSLRHLVASDGGICAGMRFRNASLVSRAAPDGLQGNAVTEADRGLCGLALRVENPHDKPLHVWTIALPYMEKGRFKRSAQSGGVVEQAVLPAGGKDEMRIRLPLYRTGSLQYRFVVMSALNPPEDADVGVDARVGDVFGTLSSIQGLDWSAEKQAGLAVQSYRVRVGE